MQEGVGTRCVWLQYDLLHAEWHTSIRFPNVEGLHADGAAIPILDDSLLKALRCPTNRQSIAPLSALGAE
jgi:hypothetical protein